MDGGTSEALKVVGLMNIQYAVQGETVYILEANPALVVPFPTFPKQRGSFSKSCLPRHVGQNPDGIGYHREAIPRHIAVKEAVLPFQKFPGADTLLGPEMRSTGEVMGIDSDFGKAFAKAEMAAGVILATSGTVFVSMNDRDKTPMVPVVKDLQSLGFRVVATSGTRKVC